MIRRANPSAIAVLPTPASPTNSGLFFCRRHSTWIVRLISASRPISGSILPRSARQSFSDRGLARRGFADEQWIVLLPAAEHLDRPVDLGIAADQRIDLAVLGLLVEVDAIGFERVALLLRFVTALGIGFFLGAAHRARLGEPRPLGNAVADVIDRVVAWHVLVLQQIKSVALALGEDRHQHVGASDLLTAGGCPVG